MKVFVQVPQEAALRRGVAAWGKLPVELQPILDGLSEQERVQLLVEGEKLKVRVYQADGHLFNKQVVVAEPTIEAVAQAIRKELAENEKKRHARLAEWRKILADPDRCLEPDGRRRIRFNPADVERICRELGEDPQAYQDALDAAAEKVAAENRRDWQKYLDRWVPGSTLEGEMPYHHNRSRWYGGTLSIDAAKLVATEFNFDDVLDRIRQHQEALAARDAEEKRRKERSREAWIQWALDCGSDDLRRAIADQYPLGQEVEREVEQAVFPAVGSEAILVCEGVRDYEERRVPKQGARCLEAYLQDQIQTAAAKLPAGASLILGRICSVEIYIDCDCQDGCSECDEDHEVKVRRTAIPVHLVSEHHKASRWYVIAE